MSVEMACTCADLPAHSHLGRWVGGDRTTGYTARWEDTGELRMWVDWKAVARALSQETVTEAAVNHAD